MYLHHLALRTPDLGRLRAFYEGALGLPVVTDATPRSVWLGAGGAVVMLEASEPGEPGIPALSREFVAFAIEPDERAAWEARLARAGVASGGRGWFLPPSPAAAAPPPHTGPVAPVASSGSPRNCSGTRC